MPMTCGVYGATVNIGRRCDPVCHIRLILRDVGADCNVAPGRSAHNLETCIHYHQNHVVIRILPHNE